MDDLLKEAIADAKAVRETALANAKMALEEAFTPKLKSMLAQKIQQEIEDEDEVADAEKLQMQKKSKTKKKLKIQKRDMQILKKANTRMQRK